MTTTQPGDPGGTAATGPTELVRSEERLSLGTRTEVTGRVRVRKVVTSREVTQTVTVRREELVVEDLPADDAVPGAEASATEAGEIELVLHEEQLVLVSVPVERVRVRVERVTEDVTVSEPVRHERVDLDS